MADQVVARPTGPSRMEQWFPIGAWLPKYNWGSSFTPDLIAAISVAALLIPESMGYASVAGVPAQIGLYAAPLALVGYALFGGSRLLVFAAAGSVAAISAGVIAGLHPHSQSMTVTLAAALAVATGVVFLVGGLVKLGWIVNFMSKAVIAGFITGMAIQIIVGQLGHVTGVKESSGDTFQKLWSVLSHAGSWNWTSTAVGLLAIALIFTLQRYLKAVPAALTAVVLASVYVAIANPDIELVKKIPKGLPSFAVPTGLSASTWATLLLGACVVALVGFSEGWGAESAIASTTHDELDSNQEFRAFGVGSIGAGLLGGMAVAGSLSKTSAAMTAGAKTQMANVFLAVFVLLTLLLFAPLFQWLPEAVLAAVVINAMWGSASPKKVMKLRRDDLIDFVLGIVTGIAVLATDLLPAMILGIILSIIYLIYRVSFPSRAELGRDEKTGDFEALHWMSGTKQGEGNPGARGVSGVMLYRFDAPLVFSNAGAFKASGQQILIDTAARGPLPPALVIDFEEVFYTDASGAESIRDLKRYASRYDVEILIARLHADAREILARDGVLAEIGEDHIYDSVHAAVAASNGSTDQEDKGARQMNEIAAPARPAQ
jgi:sulfate permease, SulP family